DGEDQGRWSRYPGRQMPAAQGACRHLASRHGRSCAAPGAAPQQRGWPCTAASPPGAVAQGDSWGASWRGERVAEAQELLSMAQYLEGILQAMTLGCRDILRFDIVVRFAAFLDIQRLVTYACQRQELQRIAQPLHLLPGHQAGLGNIIQSIVGVLRSGANGQCVHPDQISQRCGSPALEVDDVALFAILLHDKGAKYPQRWSAVQGVARHQREEVRIAAGLVGDQFAQLFNEVRLAADRV